MYPHRPNISCEHPGPRWVAPPMLVVYPTFSNGGPSSQLECQRQWRIQDQWQGGLGLIIFFLSYYPSFSSSYYSFFLSLSHLIPCSLFSLLPFSSYLLFFLTPPLHSHVCTQTQGAEALQPPVDLPPVRAIELMDSTGMGTRPLFFPTLVDQHILNQGLSDNNAQGQEQSFGNNIHMLLHCLVETVDEALNDEKILHSNVGVCSDVLPYFYYCLICEFLEARDLGPQCVCLPNRRYFARNALIHTSYDTMITRLRYNNCFALPINENRWSQIASDVAHLMINVVQILFASFVSSQNHLNHVSGSKFEFKVFSLSST